MTETAEEPRPAPVAPSAEPAERRRVVFVVGARRCGSTTLAGSLQALGLHVPQPEVVADEHNPSGYAESQWVVDFHDGLLNRCNVTADDARPSAWFAAGKVANHGPTRVRAHEWLEQQFATLGGELVVKDPGLVWFIGIWRAAALRCDAEPAYATVLRSLPEVVGSQQRRAGTEGDDIQRTASWLNLVLHTERATRGGRRAFVRYADLLEDWTIPVHDLGRRFDLDAVQMAPANRIRAAAAFIDPRLRRSSLTWDDLRLPSRLRELARETWEQLDLLPGADDTTAAEAALDQLRAAYADLYLEAEAVAHSTADAAFREGRRAALAEAEAGPAPLAERARRRLKRALGREG